MLYLGKLESFFDHYGWIYELLDPTTIKSDFQGERRAFRFFVRISDIWIYFILLPFVNKPKPESKPQLYEYLLKLNYEMDLVKAGVDEDGDVFLAVELPANDLDYEHFSDALDALSYYADKYYLQALNLAMDPTYRPLNEG
jgi:hypothetical protein